MMARRGEAVWRAPHNEPQRGQRARQALPKGASRCFRPRFRSRWQCSCEDSTTLPSRKSEALSASFGAWVDRSSTASPYVQGWSGTRCYARRHLRERTVALCGRYELAPCRVCVPSGLRTRSVCLVRSLCSVSSPLGPVEYRPKGRVGATGAHGATRPASVTVGCRPASSRARSAAQPRYGGRTHPAGRSRDCRYCSACTT